ncbi:MAG: cyclase family protein [Candidatus Tectomicrobia bacterium]|nr:cyclase family protein [Candidatus Tectomicrobia bacterium]
MCAPLVIEKVKDGVSRRNFLGVLGASVALGSLIRPAQAQMPEVKGFSKVQDLTHTLSANFPLFPGFEPLQVKNLVTVKANGFYVNRWDIGEHTGTHMDAPAHFVDPAPTAEKIPAERLIAPLVVIHIHERAQSNEDAQVMVTDLADWEKQHGRIPRGAFIAMHSGWEARVSEPKRFVNQDASGTLHFPAFHPEAGEFLVKEREIVGIGVDTLSLDFGPSKDFKTHLIVLGAGKYGLENLANLAAVPPSGATVIVGGPKVENASGGPVRAFAVW